MLPFYQGSGWRRGPSLKADPSLVLEAREFASVALVPHLFTCWSCPSFRPAMQDASTSLARG